MMNKNEFWELIQISYREADWETDKEMELLTNKLSEYSQEEILKFGKIYEVYAQEANRKKLQAAAHIMVDGCEKECFKKFIGWLISRGKEPYLNALQNPDSIVDLDMPYEDDYYENEEMQDIAQEAFIKKIGTDKAIDIYFEENKDFKLDSEEIDSIVSEISFDEDITADWDKNDEEGLKNLLPNIYEKFW